MAYAPPPNGRCSHPNREKVRGQPATFRCRKEKVLSHRSHRFQNGNDNDLVGITESSFQRKKDKPDAKLGILWLNTPGTRVWQLDEPLFRLLDQAF